MKYKINQNGDNILESVYNNRNIDDDFIDRILYSQTWEEPSTYKNMEKGYELLMNTIEKGGDIGVIVDPDVDGYASAATEFSFIYDDLKYDNIWYIIKDKSKKSHGIDREVIEKVKENKFDLIILPDGGSNDFKYQNEILNLGCKVLIIDHHIYDTERKTDAIIINNQDNNVENTYLSGCGVTYKFCFYCAEREGIDLGYKYLDLVALSLISDVCDMTSLENRYLFNLGSQVSNVSNRLMKSFIKDLKIKNKISIESYGFGVAPLINSIIRVGEGSEKESLFESLINSNEEVNYRYRSKDITQSIQDSILRIGRRLKNKQKTMVEKAIKEGLNVLSNDKDKVLIIDGKSIDSEIRGLLCTKLMSEHKKPVMILSGDEIMRGSARGINSINFKDLCERSNLFNYCEGHIGAFGVSIQLNNIGKFIQFVNKELLGIDLDNFTEVDFVYEGYMPLDDVLVLGTDLEDLWCNQIKRPKILIKNIKINSSNIVKKGINLSFKINNVLYKRDFCSTAFYQDLICYDDNENIDKDLLIDIICEVKTTENNISYINIVEFESSVDMQTPLV